MSWTIIRKLRNIWVKNNNNNNNNNNPIIIEASNEKTMIEDGIVTKDATNPDHDDEKMTMTTIDQGLRNVDMATMIVGDEIEAMIVVGEVMIGEAVVDETTIIIMIDASGTGVPVMMIHKEERRNDHVSSLRPIIIDDQKHG